MLVVTLNSWLTAWSAVSDEIQVGLKGGELGRSVLRVQRWAQHDESSCHFDLSKSVSLLCGLSKEKKKSVNF